MGLRELREIKLPCGTIAYSLSECEERFMICVKNMDTHEICIISGLYISEKFASGLLGMLVNGTVTPVTAYDIVRDALCDIRCLTQPDFSGR